ncbi:MAG TPA: NRDE family protein [Ideonella sp.]|nr:NRDE family protein [Ideonella sp.]
MCLVVIALGQSERYPLVIAANRDEFYDRPAAPLGWWSPAGASLPVLGGRDLRGGGTWLGLGGRGRLALLTNIREPSRHVIDAPSRGALVPEWLCGDADADTLHERTAGGGYNGFNLIAADFARGTVFHLSNREAAARPLAAGVYGLSNAGLDTPWPKVNALKTRLAAGLSATPSAQSLRDALLEALADRRPASDEVLPATGVPREWERLLSAAFIAAPEHGYGTRCSTVVVTERRASGLTTRVWERSFDAASAAVDRCVELAHWPPDRT